MSMRLLATLIGLLVAAPTFAAETYTIDSKHTLPVYEIDHFNWSTQRGRFNKVTGRITLDRVARTGSMDVTIDVASIDSGVAKLDEHLLSEDFFHVAQHPTMTFRSDRIVFEGDEPRSVPGQFTMRGVTRPMTLAISSFHCAENPFAKKMACGANAVATVRRSEFGMSTYAPGLGDEVRLLINVEAFKD